MSGFEGFALATAAVSSALGAAKTITAGSAQARQAAAEAAFLRGQADYQRQLAATQEAALRRKQSRDLSRMRALLAGRDIDIASGSALLAQEQGAADAEFEALLQRSAGAAQVAAADFQAQSAAARASQARKNALFDAGTSLLTAAEKAGKFGDHLGWFKPAPKPPPKKPIVVESVWT